jgi:CubicO group peptidase (beta-lactamase class C family)
MRSITKQLFSKSGTISLLILISLIFLPGGWLSAKDTSDSTKLANGLLPPVLIKGEKPWTMQDRMWHHRVPGVSVAVIKDFKVFWAKGFGVKDMTAKLPVTEATLFQAASISKPVAAMAALKWVEAGKFKLDQNINKILKSWQLPDNQFTAKQAVTLRHLLSHSGGVTVHGFRGYTASQKTPTLLQLLDGKAPANSEPIRVNLLPGQKFRYAGGGFCIVQQMLVDTLKQSFPIIMADTVLKPVGMTHSTYLQPLPGDRAQFAASGHRPAGLAVDGKWHTYPEMAAAGLWTTATDMARFAIELQLSLLNKSNKVLTQEMAKEMLTPFGSDFMALGLMLSQKGNALYFQHAGANEGFRCLLIAQKEKGYGAVVMTNSDNGSQLASEIVRGIAGIYNWEDYLPKLNDVIKLAPEVLKILVGKFAVDSDHLAQVSLENGQLFVQVTSGDKAALYPISESKFIRKDQTGIYEFVKDVKTGKLLHLSLERRSVKRFYDKKGDDYNVPLSLFLSGQVEKAVVGYRQLRKENPADPNVEGMRMLYLTQNLIVKGKIKEALALLHLTAEFHPQLIKQMQNTLDTEITMMLKSPMMPDQYKKIIKDSYNSMLKKLGLKELE